MPIIYSYQKYIDPEISRVLRMPYDIGTFNPIGTELATVDGVTYVSLPDSAVLPEDQAEEIVASIQQITLSDEQKSAINAASPHVRLIHTRGIEKIRAVYSTEDEAVFARIGVGVALGIYAFQPGEQQALQDFGDFVQSIRDWESAEMAKLGL